MADTNVIKTLVIGLGSTGAKICDALVDRIRWELQDVRRAPWVRMLCVETDVNQQSRLRDSDDFLPMSLSDAEYRQILEHPEAYDEKILLSRWVDKKTLQALPQDDVTSGAGNIRMVGRLAFLYERNYNAIKQHVQQRLDALRELNIADAMTIRGPLPDGSNPGIEFGAGGRVRVFVVGTLCGGTCSGVISDFGYFLRGMCTPEENTFAMVTLPRPDLTVSLVGEAERYKRNAYQALTELNHYCLSARPDEPPILFPDGVCADLSKFPFTVPYLRHASECGRTFLGRASSCHWGSDFSQHLRVPKLIPAPSSLTRLSRSRIESTELTSSVRLACQRSSSLFNRSSTHALRGCSATL